MLHVVSIEVVDHDVENLRLLHLGELMHMPQKILDEDRYQLEILDTFRQLGVLVLVEIQYVVNLSRVALGHRFREVLCLD